MEKGMERDMKPSLKGSGQYMAFPASGSIYTLKAHDY